MDLDDCPKNDLGLPVPTFAITTAKRAQWNLWLLRRIWGEEITATEDDLRNWFDTVPVENPGTQQAEDLPVNAGRGDKDGYWWRRD